MSAPLAQLPDIEDAQWRPLIPGWSKDILPFYARVAGELVDGDIVVEVGVHSGRSIFYLAEQLLGLGKRNVELYAIDWWRGPQFRQQLLKTMAENRFNGITAQEIDMVKVVSFEGARAARLFRDDELAGVFIDSDHEEKGMLEHLAAWAPKVKTGGFIAGHDYCFEDWPGVVRAVDEFFNPHGAEGDDNPIGRPTRTVWEVRQP
jgi:cephalosporin hydroxylase